MKPVVKCQMSHKLRAPLIHSHIIIQSSCNTVQFVSDLLMPYPMLLPSGIVYTSLMNVLHNIASGQLKQLKLEMISIFIGMVAWIDCRLKQTIAEMALHYNKASSF